MADGREQAYVAALEAELGFYESQAAGAKDEGNAERAAEREARAKQVRAEIARVKGTPKRGRAVERAVQEAPETAVEV